MNEVRAEVLGPVVSKRAHALLALNPGRVGQDVAHALRDAVAEPAPGKHVKVIALTVDVFGPVDELGACILSEGERGGERLPREHVQSDLDHVQKGGAVQARPIASVALLLVAGQV